MKFKQIFVNALAKEIHNFRGCKFDYKLTKKCLENAVAIVKKNKRYRPSVTTKEEK